MNQPTLTLHQQIQQYERSIIAATVSNHQRLYQFGDALGIRYSTLWPKMKQYEICSDA